MPREVIRVDPRLGVALLCSIYEHALGGRLAYHEGSPRQGGGRRQGNRRVDR